MKYRLGDKVIYQPILIDLLGVKRLFGPNYYCTISHVYDKSSLVAGDYRIFCADTQHESSIREDYIRKPRWYEYLLFL